MIRPNKEEFDKVCKELQHEQLNLVHIHRIFGQSFFELMMLSLSYAREDAVILEWLRKKDA